MKYNKLRSVVLCLIVIALASCKKRPDDVIVHINKEEFTIEEQEQIGNSLQQLILNSPNDYTILERDDYNSLYDYLNTLLLSMVNTTHVDRRADFNWDVTVIHDDAIKSAFILPGGHLFLYTGLLKTIASENELISILAHEISYADDDYLIQALKAEYGGLLLGDILLDKTTDEIQDMANTVSSVVFLKEEVAHADSTAMEIICPFQYNAYGLSNFIERCSNTGTDVAWLSTRPSTSDRVANIMIQAEACGEEEPTFTERYLSYKNMLP